MVKKINNNPVKTIQTGKTNKLAKQVLFEPTLPQQKMKARFWTRFQPGPLTDPHHISEEVVAEVTQSPQIKKWWVVPGFKHWFMNHEEERERLRYLFSRSLDTMEEILSNPESNANARANIIKLLAEMNGYVGKRPVDRFADDAINKMSEDQLKTFLERKGVTITQEQVIDAGDKDSEK